MRALCLGLIVLALRCRVLGLRFGVFGQRVLDGSAGHSIRLRVCCSWVSYMFLRSVVMAFTASGCRVYHV